MNSASHSFQDVPLTRDQADRLLAMKARQIFEVPAVLERVKDALRDPSNPLDLSKFEKETFKQLDQGMKHVGKLGRLPGVGRVAKGVTNALDNRIREEAVSSDRAKEARGRLLDALKDPAITVGSLELAMEEIGQHMREFAVLGLDDDARVRSLVPEGVDPDQFISDMKSFSAEELAAVGAIDAASDRWQSHVRSQQQSAQQLPDSRGR